jgi:hypothetical protein
MDGINRTGGQDAAAISAAAKARMERIADEASKYRLPGMAAGAMPKPGEGEKPPPVPPMNLAQLRLWVEKEGGGSIDVLA